MESQTSQDDYEVSETHEYFLVKNGTIDSCGRFESPYDFICTISKKQGFESPIAFIRLQGDASVYRKEYSARLFGEHALRHFGTVDQVIQKFDYVFL